MAATVYFILLGTRAWSGRIFHIITAVITGTVALSYLIVASGAALETFGDVR